MMNRDGVAASSPMSYEEYANDRHEPPYELHLVAGDNHLYYFGERHSFDPADLQWTRVKALWNEFLEHTSGRKRVAFVEGGVRAYIEPEAEAIIKDGGMGLVTYLAHEADIQIYSPEPNVGEQLKELEKSFSHKEIEFYAFASIVYQWQRKHEPRPDFEEHVAHYLIGDKRESGWKDVDYSLEGMRKIHQEIFGDTFTPPEDTFWYDIVNPVQTDTVINRVSRASSQMRDEHIVREIVHYIRDGYSIFAEYGFSHVLMQEPLLRSLLAA